MNTTNDYTEFCDWLDHADRDITVKSSVAYDSKKGTMFARLKAAGRRRLTGKDLGLDFALLRCKLASVSGIEDPILTDSRKKEFVNARFVMMYELARLGYSARTIGYMTSRDRTSVLHGISQVKEAIQFRGGNPELHDLYAKFTNPS